jgi:hypothetical protein
MTFLTVLAASFLGQLGALWIIGTLAYRQQEKKAEAIQKAFEQTVKEMEEREIRMREYARMES